MRCFLPVFLLALAAPALAFAQKAKIDSLEQVIAMTNEDTTKTRGLCALCKQLRIAGQMDAALKKGNAGLKLAREAGDLYGAKGLVCCKLVMFTFIRAI